MIEEPATVLRVAGDAAWVRCEREAGCARCAEGRGCGGGLLGRLLGDRLREIRVLRQPADLQAGERVILALDEGVLLRGAFLVYLLPLLCLGLGAGLAAWAASAWLPTAVREPAAVAGALAGLAAGFAWARLRVSRADTRDFEPRILARTPTPGPSLGCRLPSAR